MNYTYEELLREATLYIAHGASRQRTIDYLQSLGLLRNIAQNIVDEATKIQLGGIGA